MTAVLFVTFIQVDDVGYIVFFFVPFAAATSFRRRTASSTAAFADGCLVTASTPTTTAATTAATATFVVTLVFVTISDSRARACFDRYVVIVVDAAEFRFIDFVIRIDITDFTAPRTFRSITGRAITAGTFARFIAATAAASTTAAATTRLIRFVSFSPSAGSGNDLVILSQPQVVRLLNRVVDVTFVFVQLHVSTTRPSREWLGLVGFAPRASRRRLAEGRSAFRPLATFRAITTFVSAATLATLAPLTTLAAAALTSFATRWTVPAFATLSTLAPFSSLATNGRFFFVARTIKLTPRRLTTDSLAAEANETFTTRSRGLVRFDSTARRRFGFNLRFRFRFRSGRQT